MIVPSGLCSHTWYDIASGRRRDDERPGMVLLDLGDRRVHVPARCLEFRDAVGVPAATPSRRLQFPHFARRLAMATSPRAAVAASLVPVGLLALIAIRRDSAR